MISEKTMFCSGELRLAQKDGCQPTTLAAGCAAGESGVSVFSARFCGGMHLQAATSEHLICFQTEALFDCRIADQVLRHVPRTGSLAICPAGVDCAANAEGSVDAIIIAVKPTRLALAAAQDSIIEPRLIERLAGYDQELLNLAQGLASESADDYPDGPLFWNELASAFVDGLLARHTADFSPQARGTLGTDVLKQLKDYIIAHIDEPIEVATLAAIAALSPFHFSRVFKGTVGLTPHRYIVQLRLQKAIELLRAAGSTLAEAAARSGFADQSHLSRWVRRAYGIRLSRLTD